MWDRMTGNKSDKCEICGKNLIYATNIEKYKELRCVYCNKKDTVNTYCIDNHFICDSCHAKGAKEIIIDVCEKTDLKDPFELADLKMKHPKFNLYGPEHHILTPAVILTVLSSPPLSIIVVSLFSPIKFIVLSTTIFS